MTNAACMGAIMKYGRNIKNDSSLAASVERRLTRRPLSAVSELDFSLKVCWQKNKMKISDYFNSL